MRPKGMHNDFSLPPWMPSSKHYTLSTLYSCNVKFPIIADVDRKIATKYGMLDYQDADNVDKKGMPLTVRSVFVIDTKNVIRLIIT